MDISLLRITLHEPDVALTDWALAGETLIFFALLMQEKSSPRKTAVLITLLALMLASLLGGAYHGFFPARLMTSGGWVMWMATMLSIGLASAGLLFIAGELLLPGSPRVITVLCATLLAVYAAYVLGIDQSFRTAIVFYLPALLAFLAAMIVTHVQGKQAGSSAGIVAILLMLLGSGLQQMKIGLHPLYFNHNALYHLLQGIALVLLFIALQALVRKSKKQPH